jgi:hypothetical protein
MLFFIDVKPEELMEMFRGLMLNFRAKKEHNNQVKKRVMFISGILRCSF